ncbi:MAG: hypothetical protein GF329_21935 [Candidatus Lokiarchaeota archaeon]|nr:hypothetical protein [Candidatus Lokiarchaeota archaeon]
MNFLSLLKIKSGKQEQCLELLKKIKEKPLPGIEIKKIMFCLGKYDLIIIGEADEVKTLELSARLTLYAQMETLTTIPFEAGIEMLKDIYWFKRENELI